MNRLVRGKKKVVHRCVLIRNRMHRLVRGKRKVVGVS